MRLKQIPLGLVERKDWVYKKPPRPRIVTCFPNLSSTRLFAVHNNSIANGRRAILERVKYDVFEGELVPIMKPRRQVFEHRGADFRARWLDAMGPVRVHSAQEVIMSYVGGKRKLYQKAYQSLQRDPFHDGDARITAFVKTEKIDVTAKTDPCPRLIQPRKTRFNLELGKYLKLNEGRMKKAIDKVFGSTVVLSGYDSFTVGRIIHSKWRKFRSPVAVSIDMSRMDRSVSVDALKYEHSFYLGHFGHTAPLLAQLLDNQLSNACTFVAKDGAITYTVDGGRMSGDMNTSVGNMILVCMMYYAYIQHYGLNIELGDNGDDAFCIMEVDDLELFQSTIATWFEDFGFKAACEEPVYEIEEIEFCQSRPVWIDGNYRMIRSMKSLSKDCYTTLSMKTRGDFEAWMSAVGQCGIVLNQSCPVLYALHARMVELGQNRTVNREFMKKVIEYGNVERLGGLKFTQHEISDRSRISFFKAFGIPPARQLLLEQYYSGVQHPSHTNWVNSHFDVCSAINLVLLS